MNPVGNMSPLMFDVAGASGINSQSTEEQIESVGNEFESVFLSMMLKEMRKSLDNGGFFGEESSDTYGGMFDLFIGKHLAESKPLGISDMLVQQYKKSNPSPDDDGNDSSKPQTTKTFTA
ncbi:MAG: hypothetical protein HKN47_16910 [Pirellulaceae bacterium]|nr:hypothetical protein [Pirellulaceae bacterium]